MQFGMGGKRLGAFRLVPETPEPHPVFKRYLRHISVRRTDIQPDASRVQEIEQAARVPQSRGAGVQPATCPQ